MLVTIIMIISVFILFMFFVIMFMVYFDYMLSVGFINPGSPMARFPADGITTMHDSLAGPNT